jgi:hypothetical protein
MPLAFVFPIQGLALASLRMSFQARDTNGPRTRPFLILLLNIEGYLGTLTNLTIAVTAIL